MQYIHYKKDKDHLLHITYLALIPFLLFGFYKNGLLLYFNDLITFQDIFIPLYFYVISIFIGFFVAKILKESKKEQILFSLILSCTVSINTNIIFYPIVLFISLIITNVLNHKITFNNLSLAHLLLLFALFMQSYSYLNVGEKIEAFNYDLFDIFLGFGSGGLATTSFLFVLIGFIILASQKFYKKIIFIASSLSFFSILLFLFLFTQNSTYLQIMFNGTVYFGFLFVGAHLFVSPNTKQGMLLYGFAIGILSAILTIFLPFYEVSFISIFLISIFIPIINQIFAKKYLQS